MNIHDWIDAGVVDANDDLHPFAATIGCSLCGVTVIEPAPNSWGQNPAKFRENVLREVTSAAPGTQARVEALLQLLGDERPELREAIASGRLRFLVAKDAAGRRKMALAIESSETAAKRHALMGTSPPGGELPPPAPGCFGLLIVATLAGGFFLSRWIWGLQAESFPSWMKFVVIAIVAIQTLGIAGKIGASMYGRAAPPETQR